jgi:uncharacterized protein YdhG (YjbR/CyaY superfamily)
MAKKKAATKSPVKASKVFSEAERDAMVERAREVKAERAGADLEEQVLAKIAEMDPSDRAMARKIHAIVMASAPGITARLWYGMPAYSTKDGKTLCFFQDAKKFKARYATFGFNDVAKLDDGDVWATGFAVKRLTPAGEEKIRAIVKKAVG